MDLKEKLEIIIVTYNRKNFLLKTLEILLAENSPVKNLSISILNNNSNDGSTELINEMLIRYPNLKHVLHRKNIGGNANITRAIELASKEYVWILGDNDEYSWESWQEVENAIYGNYDAIITSNIKNNIANIFYSCALISGCIYKTVNITETVLSNAYDNIRFLFPHLAVCAKNINENNRFYIVSKDIVKIGVNPNMMTTYCRGFNIDEIPEPRRNIFWSVGYFNSLELIQDRKKRTEIINGLRHYHKTLFDLFRTIVILNQLQNNGYKYNLQQIFRFLNWYQKIKFILAFLSVKLSWKNYKFWFLRYEKDWIEYLEIIEEAKYIKQLENRFSNKKIILYGAGLTAKVLFENYDFSKLNIIGIADKKFEDNAEKEFFGIKTLSPSELTNHDFDVIIFTMKEYKKIVNNLKANGCKKKMLSIIKKSRYALRI